MKKITVLLTAAGAQFAPEVAHCLTNNGERQIKLVGVDVTIDKGMEKYCDIIYAVPKANDPQYIWSLLEICEKESVNFLIPFMSAELQVLHENKNLFEEKGTIIALSNYSSIKIANNKGDFYDFLKENGIQNISYKRVNSLEQFEIAAKDLGYPLNPFCVKIPLSSGSRGVRIIDNSKSDYELFVNEKPNSMYISYDMMLKTLKESDVFPELLLAEYLGGVEHTVDLLADNGEILYFVSRDNLQIKASIPNCCVSMFRSDAFLVCKKIIKQMNYTGNACFDFKLNDKGDAILMEMNPRISATISFAYNVGVNLIYLRLKQLLNEPLPVIKSTKKLKMIRRFLDYYEVLE